MLIGVSAIILYRSDLIQKGIEIGNIVVNGYQRIRLGVYPVVGTIAALFVFMFAPFAAAYTGSEYSTTTTWTQGSVVSVDASGELIAASLAATNYVGVVTQQPDSATVEVADSGVVPVLVTDEAGEIASGTRIGLSSVAGIASTWTGGVALGVAQETPTSWQEATLSNESSVRIATVQVQLLTDGAASDSSPMSVFFAAIDRTAAGIAGKSVDTWRVVTALLIGLGGLILAFGLLFISSRESFFSMGRNPMASKIIMGGLWKMVFLAVGIMLITLTAAYLIVRVG